MLEMCSVLLLWSVPHSHKVSLMLGYMKVVRVVQAVVFGNVRVTLAVSTLVSISDVARLCFIQHSGTSLEIILANFAMVGVLVVCAVSGL